MRIVALLFGSLVVLSLLPISGAVVATGRVAVEGNYKAVQHFEGGIVAEILVKNGAAVMAGDVLVRLDATPSRAIAVAISQKVVDHAIQEARLIAERAGRPSLLLPEGLGLTAPEAAKTLARQKSLLETRREAHFGQINLLKQRLAQAESELKSIAARYKARRRERALIEKELAMILPLYEKGFVNQQRIGPLQREAARLDGELGTLRSETVKLKSARDEAAARLTQLDKDHAQQIATELETVQMSLAEERETLKAATDRLARTDIRAPVAGTVHNLMVHTQGAVIPPGGEILQIVPKGGELVVEARLAPRDIDRVHIGQQANVRFSAFDAHATPQATGTLRRISPAELANPDGSAYYSAEVRVPPDELNRTGTTGRLVPGMPAEVYLETRSRTILSYFMKPFADMLARSFRER